MATVLIQVVGLANSKGHSQDVASVYAPHSTAGVSQAPLDELWSGSGM
jgi:hypothetical protein